MSHSNRLDNGVIVISNSDESGEVEFVFNDGRRVTYRWEALRHGLRAKEVVPPKPMVAIDDDDDTSNVYRH